MAELSVHLDFETRGVVELSSSGSSRYAEDEGTDILCAAYAFGEEPVQLWLRHQSPPTRLLRHVAGGGRVVAHNAAFEYDTWNRVGRRVYGWPELKFSQMDCTAARAAAMNLPRSLDGAAKAVQLPIVKDQAGYALMMRMCKPRAARRGENPKGVYWHESRADIDRLGLYCVQDVEVERQLEKRLLKLPAMEQRVFQMDHRINQHGVKLDLPTIRGATKVAVKATYDLDLEMAEITGGAVSACSQVARLLRWLAERGVQVGSLGKEHLDDILEEIDTRGLPDLVARAVVLRRLAAKASAKKLVAMEAVACADGRARGLHMYYGASTGRFAGRLIQTQNLPRPKLKMDKIEKVLPLLRGLKLSQIAAEFGNPLDVISDSLRSMLIAEKGNRFLCADFANIEGRVLAWAAGQYDLVEVFRNNGPVYERMAAAIYDIPVEEVGPKSEERNIGKRAVLGCGYSMGAAKFEATCKKDGIILPIGMAAKTVAAYRAVNGEIKKFWKNVNNASVSAMEERGTAFHAGPIAYKLEGSFLKCRLPSGRCLFYPFPSIRKEWKVWNGEEFLTEAEWKEEAALLRKEGTEPPKLRPTLHRSVEYWGLNKVSKQWSPQRLYGGKLVENAIQAIARDILVESMLRLESHGYPIAFHVHDEVISERRIGEGKLREFMSLMSEVPKWAAGCPVAVGEDAWEGERYRK